MCSEHWMSYRLIWLLYCVPASGDSRLSLGITLSSNEVSEDATNGTVIGNVTVINKRQGETYRLRIVNQQTVPFRIINDQLVLVLAIGSPLDYEETNSTAVSIMAIGSKGKTVQQLFLIKIKSKHLHCSKIYTLFFINNAKFKQSPQKLLKFQTITKQFSWGE